MWPRSGSIDRPRRRGITGRAFLRIAQVPMIVVPVSELLIFTRAPSYAYDETIFAWHAWYSSRTMGLNDNARKLL